MPSSFGLVDIYNRRKGLARNYLSLRNKSQREVLSQLNPALRGGHCDANCELVWKDLVLIEKSKGLRPSRFHNSVRDLG
jgi:hypothetical protein